MGIDFPGRLFSLLKKYLYIEKGALLLLESTQKQYVPWALCGFDETTHHRIRLHFSVINNLEGLTRGEITLLEKEELVPLQHYFSLREFGLISRMLLCPLSCDNKLVGILMIADPMPYQNEKENFLAICQLIKIRAGKLLFQTRESSVNKLLKDRDESLENTLQKGGEFLDKQKNRNAECLVMIINSSGFLEQITAINKELDPFRIKQDITNIFKTLVSENGFAGALEKNYFLLIFSGESVVDVDILFHQIGIALQSFFKNQKEAPRLEQKGEFYTPQSQEEGRVFINKLFQGLK